MKLIIKQGDITEEKVDAIVNAANESLMGGGGVDGAIHRAAGRGLVEECRTIPYKDSFTTSKGEQAVLGYSSHPRCLTGEAEITGGHNLQAKHVIHTVGPICPGGIVNEQREQDLKNCWTNSLKLADENNLKSIAFPSISTGAYCFPIAQAAKIAIQSILDYSDGGKNTNIEELRIVCFSEDDYHQYKNVLNNIVFDEKKTIGESTEEDPTGEKAGFLFDQLKKIFNSK